MDMILLCQYPEDWKLGEACGKRCIEMLSEFTCNDNSPIAENSFYLALGTHNHYMVFVSSECLEDYCKHNNINLEEHKKFVCDWADGFVNGYSCRTMDPSIS